MIQPGDLVLVNQVPKTHTARFRILVGMILEVEKVQPKNNIIPEYARGFTDCPSDLIVHVKCKLNDYYKQYDTWLPIDYVELVFTQ
jgi:predicted Abi (CAAX) family protease